MRPTPATPPVPGTSVRATWRRVRPFAVGGGRAFALVAACSAVGGLLEAAVLVLVTKVAVGLSATTTTVELPVLGAWSRASVLLLTAGLLLAKLAVQLVATHQAASLATRSLSVARLGLLRDFLGATWARQSSAPLGTLQELMTTHVDRVSGILLQSAVGVVAATNVAALVLAALVVNPLAALGIVVTGVALSALMRPLTRRIRHHATRQVEAGRTYAAAVTETVTMARDIRVMNATGAVVAEVAAHHRANAEPYRRSRFLTAFAPHLYQTLAIGTVLLALAVVGGGGSADVAALGAVVILLLRALSFSQAAQTAYHQVSELTPYLDDLAREQEQYRRDVQDQGGRPLGELGAIRLEAVEHRYLPDRVALGPVDLCLAPGEAVGVVGPSGSGKSTLVALLLRLRVPTAGAIVVDGRRLEEVSLRSWYDHVAYVPQVPQLFTGTIAANIDFHRGRPRDRIEAAAAAAHLTAEVEALPDGFDTVVGADGGDLSGGQRQRICIARALLGAPDLIVLDEPTSALDARSEAAITETLRDLHGRTTLVVVAHRLSTLSTCDRIVVLDGGLVEAQGSHEEVAVGSAYYRDAVRLGQGSD